MGLPVVERIHALYMSNGKAHHEKEVKKYNCSALCGYLKKKNCRKINRFKKKKSLA